VARNIEDAATKVLLREGAFLLRMNRARLTDFLPGLCRLLASCSLVRLDTTHTIARCGREIPIAKRCVAIHLSKAKRYGVYRG
jgi:hypothetical protein